MSEQELIRRLCHCAIHYLLVLSEPLPHRPLVGEHVLAESLHACWTDAIFASSNAALLAERVLGGVRSYRSGEKSLEQAVSDIQTIQREVEERSVA